MDCDAAVLLKKSKGILAVLIIDQTACVSLLKLAEKVV